MEEDSALGRAAPRGAKASQSDLPQIHPCRCTATLKSPVLPPSVLLATFPEEKSENSGNIVDMDDTLTDVVIYHSLVFLCDSWMVGT